MRVSLLSTTCSTRPFGTGRGELWLTEDALVRIGKPGWAMRAAAASGLAGAGLCAGVLLLPNAALAAVAVAVGAGLGVLVLVTGRRPAAPEGATLEVTPDEWAEHLDIHEGVLVLPLADVLAAEVSSRERGTALTVTLAGGPVHSLHCGRSGTLEAALRTTLASRIAR